jgi:hypothetical protein
MCLFHVYVYMLSTSTLCSYTIKTHQIGWVFKFRCKESLLFMMGFQIPTEDNLGKFIIYDQFSNSN